MEPNLDRVRQLNEDRVIPDAVIDHRAWLRQHLKGTTWKLAQRALDGDAWLGRIRGQPIQVIWSIAIEEDEQSWIHVSLSHRSRVPVWDEVVEVKDAFIGPDRWAAQLHPPEPDYVNIHPRVLHLWAPWKTWPLPDFTRGTGSI